MTTLPPPAAKKLGLVIDLDVCVGCHACVVSCKEWNTGGYGAALSDQHPYGAEVSGTFLNRVHSFEVVPEGGKIVGKEEIRAYWTRQWGEFDPYVEPLAMTEEAGGKTRVRVHQLVKSLQGDVLSDSEVLHVFTLNAGLIAAMDLGNEADPIGPSPAFAHRS